MSQLLPAEVWHRIYNGLLRQRDLLLEHTWLAPLVPAFEAVNAELAHALAPPSYADPDLVALKNSARALDRSHDEAHQSLRDVIRAVAGHIGDGEGLIAQGLAALYPNGFNFLHEAWASEVVHTAAFSSRLERAPVKTMMALVRTQVPTVDDWAHDCIKHGEQLGVVLDQIEARAGELGSNKARIFEVRMRARAEWTYLLATLDLRYPVGIEVNDTLRAKLLAGWERAQATWQVDEVSPEDAPAEPGSEA
jgi:hypothetical protein